MDFAFTDDQLALATTVRKVLAEHCPPSSLRASAQQTGARLPGWSQLAEVGFFGLLVPESSEGLGLGLVDAILALEETGRAALPGPVVETAAIAPFLLTPECLARLAAGDLRVSVRLGGQVYAPDADAADLLIIEHRGALHTISSELARLTPQPGVDPVRRLFSVAVEGAGTVPLAAVAPPAVRVATVAVAAQLIGLARHLLETSVAYARGRTQFGAPIGSFQAVKHLLADVAIAVDFAAPLVYAAAVALSPPFKLLPAKETELDRAVSAAKAAAGEAAAQAARVALQVHGAVGYTDELDLRYWLARVWSLDPAYGSAALHRSRLRTAILGSPELRRWP
ncbi:acyl-CoA/acyl-ACP dehydrogenase [Streptosporangiaceae bacterium NEAU-GS5]|nr:acyl-CoA/acyl-ACP dehydrogenase [Streptosporangiaceae bacterium NEAU-GS5]